MDNILNVNDAKTRLMQELADNLGQDVNIADNNLFKKNI